MKNGLPGVVLPLDEVERPVDDLVVDRLHPLLRERAGVLDRVLAALRDTALEHAAWAVPLSEVREVLRVRVVRQLRLLVGVQVVEVAEELVEAVIRRQVLVAVAEVVLAELPRRVAEGLEELRDGRILAGDPDRRVRHPDLAQPGAVDALTGDERGPTGGAALLTVRVGEAHALVGEPVDVRGAIPHRSRRCSSSGWRCRCRRPRRRRCSAGPIPPRWCSFRSSTGASEPSQARLAREPDDGALDRSSARSAPPWGSYRHPRVFTQRSARLSATARVADRAEPNRSACHAHSQMVPGGYWIVPRR